MNIKFNISVRTDVLIRNPEGEVEILNLKETGKKRCLSNKIKVVNE